MVAFSLLIVAPVSEYHVCKIYLPYAYKFLCDTYFENAPHLAIFAILISQMAACSCKLVSYAYKFHAFISANAR